MASDIFFGVVGFVASLMANNLTFPNVKARAPVHQEEAGNSVMVFIPVSNVPHRGILKGVKRHDAEEIEAVIQVEGKYEKSEPVAFIARWARSPYTYNTPGALREGTQKTTIPFRVTQYIPVGYRVNGEYGNLVGELEPIDLGGDTVTIIRLDVAPLVRGGTWFYVLHARDTQPAHFRLVGPYETVNEARGSRPPWL